MLNKRFWKGFWQLADFRVWIASTVPMFVGGTFAYTYEKKFSFFWFIVALIGIYLIEIGKNAINMAVNILREVMVFNFLYAKNKYLRPPTINIGTIKGGDKVNIVADYCEFELDFRFLPGMTARKLLSNLRGIIKKHAKHFKIEIDGIQKPYYIKESHPLVTCLSRSMRQFKVRPRIRGSEGATVISFFQHKGIPAVATGFGCDGCAHIADEYVKISNLYKGALVLENFLKDYQFT